MKNYFLKILILFCITGAAVNAQTVSSNGTGGGDWNVGSTWLGGVVPNASSNVIIAGGDSVYTSVEVTCNNLTIYSGGKFVTGIDPIIVTNTTELESDAYFYNAAGTPVLPGVDVILDPESYVVHSGSGTLGGPTNYEFGNLIVRRNQGVTAAADLIINGDLIVDMLASNQVFRGANLSLGQSRSHTVYGDVYIYQGILSCLDVGDNSMYGIWNIEGNVYVIDALQNRGARIGPFSSANAAGLGIFNIGGNLIIDGGRIQAGTSTSAGLGTAIFNLGGNLTLTSTAGVSASTHAGPFAINFVGNGTQTVTSRIHFTFNTNVFDTVKVGSSVVFDLDTNYWRSTTGGEFVVEGSLEMQSISRLMGAGAFTLPPGGTLKIGSPEGITLSGEVGNVQVSGTRTYSSDANYEYKSDVPQVFGDALPSTLNGFAVNNANGFSLTGNMNVNASLSMINGDLDLDGNTITLGGNATLTETAGNTVKGSTGKLITTRDLNAPSGVNVGGLGSVITSASNLGSTTVERYHFIPTGSGNQGVSRVFNIIPTNNSGLNATLRMYYDESELNGIPETNLQLVKSPDGSDGSWERFGSTVDVSQNFVELTGISDFSYWSLADIANPLPVEEEDNSRPEYFSLEQNYPNPFNPSTVIKYQVPEISFVTIKVYDVLGKEVAALVNQEQTPGYYSIIFDASDLSSGLYFYTMNSGNYTSTNKMLMIK